MSTSPIFKSGNTALITGGASGIGLAMATKCADCGMNVIICDNNASNLSSAKGIIKGKVETVEMDDGLMEVGAVSDTQGGAIGVSIDSGGAGYSRIG